MEQKYEIVPNIISCKDLDYLSDMFNWNYGAYKQVINAIDNVKDLEIKTMLQNASTLFYNSMTRVLNILNDGGINE